MPRGPAVWKSRSLETQVKIELNIKKELNYFKIPYKVYRYTYTNI